MQLLSRSDLKQMLEEQQDFMLLNGKRLSAPPMKKIPAAASCDFLIWSGYGCHIEMASAY